MLKELGSAFPEFAGSTEKIISGSFDLIVPFRSFAYYHPSQKGSASLKSVLPAVTGQGYEGLPIAQGNDASLAFLNIIFGEIPNEEVVKIRQNLLDYCGPGYRGDGEDYREAGRNSRVKWRLFVYDWCYRR